MSLSRGNLRVALVHDYLNEFGGAERVLLALSEIWPNAPIYTSFYKRRSSAWERFKDKDIRISWAQYVPFWDKLVSPLRFLAPLIWNSFDFSKYDLVITSASWYITKGIRKGKRTIEVCYCHTPPRYLYGYPTSVEWQKYWPVKVYSTIVNHFMRLYDFNAAQRADYFIANSENVRRRIQKFYRRDAAVIYPPATLRVARRAGPPVDIDIRGQRSEASKKEQKSKLQALKTNYYLVVSRIVGGKGLQLAIEAANKLKLKLKIVGKPAGYRVEYERIKKIAGKNIEFLGFVTDNELAELYSGAKGFLALSTDEDFGMTLVEAMAAGTPVIAYRGGGYVESVVDPSAGSGQVATGIFFDKPTVDALVSALKQFESLRFNRSAIARYAQKFSKERFKKEIKNFIEGKTRFIDKFENL